MSILKITADKNDMNTISKELATHPIFSQTEAIKNLCNPLQYLGITTFSHLRVFNNDQLTILCNQPLFVLNYLQQQYYNADPCVNVQPISFDQGQYIVWDTVDCRGKTAEMLAASTDFNFKHIFTVIKKHANYMDFYHFGTGQSDASINQMYINHLDLLERYIAYFNAEVNRAKSLSRAYEIILNADQGSSQVNINQSCLVTDNFKQNRYDFLQAISPTVAKLTLKEMECAKLLINGCTAKEIANVLGVSFRTIEDRITSLKNKLHARNKSELIIKLFNLI